MTSKYLLSEIIVIVVEINESVQIHIPILQCDFAAFVFLDNLLPLLQIVVSVLEQAY